MRDWSIILLSVIFVACTSTRPEAEIRINDEAGLYKKISEQLYVPVQTHDLILLCAYKEFVCGTPPPPPDTTYFVPFSENDTFTGVLHKRFMPGLIYNPTGNHNRFWVQDSSQHLRPVQKLIIMEVLGKKVSADSVVIISHISSETTRTYIKQTFARHVGQWNSRITEWKVKPSEKIRGRYFY